MKRQVTILVVEDVENDILLVRRTLAKAGVPNPRYFVQTGEQAICYLRGTGPYSNRKKYPLPELVLLDLKLPGMDGFEVLQWIRANPNFADLRVVVLTTSERMRDVSRAYQLGANSFLVKPLEFENVRAFFDMLGAQLWNREAHTAPVPQPTRTPNKEAYQTAPKIREGSDGELTLLGGW